MLVPIILNFSLLFKGIWLFLPFNLGIFRIRPVTSEANNRRHEIKNQLS